MTKKIKSVLITDTGIFLPPFPVIRSGNIPFVNYIEKPEKCKGKFSLKRKTEKIYRKPEDFFESAP